MRPKDEDGLPLPAAHIRLPEAGELRQAAYIALSGDGRSVIWTAPQKLAIADKAIDHVIDGDSIPKRFYATDPDQPSNHALIEMFQVAADAVRAARRVTA